MIDYTWGYFCPHAAHTNRDNFETPNGQNKWSFTELEARNA